MRSIGSRIGSTISGATSAITSRIGRTSTPTATQSYSTPYGQSSSGGTVLVNPQTGEVVGSTTPQVYTSGSGGGGESSGGMSYASPSDLAQQSLASPQDLAPQTIAYTPPPMPKPTDINIISGGISKGLPSRPRFETGSDYIKERESRATKLMDLYGLSNKQAVNLAAKELSERRNIEIAQRELDSPNILPERQTEILREYNLLNSEVNVKNIPVTYINGTKIKSQSGVSFKGEKDIVSILTTPRLKFEGEPRTITLAEYRAQQSLPDKVSVLESLRPYPSTDTSIKGIITSSGILAPAGYLAGEILPDISRKVAMGVTEIATKVGVPTITEYQPAKLIPQKSTITQTGFEGSSFVAPATQFNILSPAGVGAVAGIGLILGAYAVPYLGVSLATGGIQEGLRKGSVLETAGNVAFLGVSGVRGLTKPIDIKIGAVPKPTIEFKLYVQPFIKGEEQYSLVGIRANTNIPARNLEYTTRLSKFFEQDPKVVVLSKEKNVKTSTFKPLGPGEFQPIKVSASGNILEPAFVKMKTVGREPTNIYLIGGGGRLFERAGEKVALAETKTGVPASSIVAEDILGLPRKASPLKEIARTKTGKSVFEYGPTETPGKVVSEFEAGITGVAKIAKINPKTGGKEIFINPKVNTYESSILTTPKVQKGLVTYEGMDVYKAIVSSKEWKALSSRGGIPKSGKVEIYINKPIDLTPQEIFLGKGVSGTKQVSVASQTQVLKTIGDIMGKIIGETSKKVYSAPGKAVAKITSQSKVSKIFPLAGVGLPKMVGGQGLNLMGTTSITTKYIPSENIGSLSLNLDQTFQRPSGGEGLFEYQNNIDMTGFGQQLRIRGKESDALLLRYGMAQINLSKEKAKEAERELTRFIQPTATITAERTNQKFREAFAQTQRMNQQQIQKQAQKFKNPFAFPRPPQTPLRKTTTTKIPGGSREIKDIRGKNRRMPESFVPLVRRYGKFKIFGMPNTLQKARETGLGVIRETLGASLRIGKVGKDGISGYVKFAQTSPEFRFARVGKGIERTTLVQRAPRRLSSSRERTEILRTRKGFKFL